MKIVAQTSLITKTYDMILFEVDNFEKDFVSGHFLYPVRNNETFYYNRDSNLNRFSLDTFKSGFDLVNNAPIDRKNIAYEDITVNPFSNRTVH